MKQQTAVQWLSDKLVEILGDKCNELTKEQTLANHYAIKEALKKEEQQIMQSYLDGALEGVEKAIKNDSISPQEYFNQTYNNQ